MLAYGYCWWKSVQSDVDATPTRASWLSAQSSSPCCRAETDAKSEVGGVQRSIPGLFLAANSNAPVQCSGKLSATLARRCSCTRARSFPWTTSCRAQFCWLRGRSCFAALLLQSAPAPAAWEGEGEAVLHFARQFELAISQHLGTLSSSVSHPELPCDCPPNAPATRAPPVAPVDGGRIGLSIHCALGSQQTRRPLPRHRVLVCPSRGCATSPSLNSSKSHHHHQEPPAVRPRPLC